MKITRMAKGEWSKIRAFFDLETEDGFVMKGFKIVEGNSGMFVGFPNQKNKDGEYNDTIFADKTLKQKVNQLALEHYNQGDSSKEKDTDDLPF